MRSEEKIIVCLLTPLHLFVELEVLICSEEILFDCRHLQHPVEPVVVALQCCRHLVTLTRMNQSHHCQSLVPGPHHEISHVRRVSPKEWCSQLPQVSINLSELSQQLIPVSLPLLSC